MHFGLALRLLRTDAGVSLSELARRLGVSTAYLSRVEHGHDAAPTPDRIATIAKELDVPPLILLEIAQGAGAALGSYLERVPQASTLFLEMARRDFGAVEIARIKAFIDREMPPRHREHRVVRLSDFLAAERVLVRVTTDDFEDVVRLAATRLTSDRAELRSLSARILEREQESSSLLGNGVAVPHAVSPGHAAAAALVTLAKPLAMRTPDGQPLRTIIVLVSPDSGGRHVQLLAHVARLAFRGLSGALADARTAAIALSRLEAIDVS